MAYKPKALQEMIDFYVEMHKNEPDYDQSIVDQAELDIEVLQGKCDSEGNTLRPQKFETHLDTYRGDLQLNLLDFIRELNDDVKEELISDGGWWAFISDKMLKDIKEEFARKNMNSAVLELRQGLLLSDVFPKIFSDWLTAMLSDFKWQVAVLEQYRQAYYSIYGHSITKDNQEFGQYVGGLTRPSIEHPRTNEKEVDEMVDLIMGKFGMTEVIENALKMEAEILATLDPEAFARAQERERIRQDRARYY